MNSLYVAIAGWCLVVIGGELLLWTIFRMRIIRISFPITGSSSRFQMLQRMRLIIFGHSLLLCAILFFVHFYLW